MEDFVTFTDWETGRPIHLKPSAILGVRQLAARVLKSPCISGSPVELGERTRIDTDYKDTLLVRESAKEVMQSICSHKGEE